MARNKTPPSMYRSWRLGWASRDTPKEAKLHGLQCPSNASLRVKFPRLYSDASQTRFRLLLFTFPLLRASATEGKPRGQSSAPRKFRRAVWHNLPCKKRMNYTKTPRLRSSTAVLRNCSGFIYWCESGKKMFQFAAGFDCERHRMPFSRVKSVCWFVEVPAHMRVDCDKNTKIVLVLDGQSEANVAAKLFVSREDEVCVRRRGETRRAEVEPWHRPRRSLKPNAKATLQIAQRAIAPPTGLWSRR